MTLIELCRELVAVDSSSQANSFDLANQIAKLSSEIGLYYELYEEFVEGESQYNILVSPIDVFKNPDPDTQYILLVNHLDCSAPGPLALWKHHSGNPFQLIIEDNNLCGLGIAENKADIAAKLMALSYYKDKPLKSIPLFLGVFGHQSGMRGMQRWIKKNRLTIKHALIGEPTQMQPVRSINGYAKIEIAIPFSQSESLARQNIKAQDSSSTSTRLFKGQPQSGIDFDHSMNLLKDVFKYFENLPSNTVLVDFDGGTQFNSQPHQVLTEIDTSDSIEDSIIERVVKLYQDFSELHNQLKQYANPQYLPKHLTFNIGMIRTHEEDIKLSGIVRIPPHVTENEVKAWEDQAKKICSRIGARISVTDYKPSYELDPHHHLLNASQNRLATMGLNTDFKSLYLSNEACLLGRKGIDCFVIGPGVSESNLHSPQEKVTQTQINQSLQFYQIWIQEENL